MQFDEKSLNLIFLYEIVVLKEIRFINLPLNCQRRNIMQKEFCFICSITNPDCCVLHHRNDVQNVADLQIFDYELN